MYCENYKIGFVQIFDVNPDTLVTLLPKFNCQIFSQLFHLGFPPAEDGKGANQTEDATPPGGQVSLHLSTYDNAIFFHR